MVTIHQISRCAKSIEKEGRIIPLALSWQFQILPEKSVDTPERFVVAGPGTGLEEG